MSHVCVVYENNACDFIFGSSGVREIQHFWFRFFIMGKQATKGQPKKTAAKEPAQKKQRKYSEPDQAQNQVIHDDSTPDEMKASIQRMLAFLKYRADGNKNKSGQEAQEVLEAMEFKIVLHALHVFLLIRPIARLATQTNEDLCRPARSLASRTSSGWVPLPRRQSTLRRRRTPPSKG